MPSSPVDICNMALSHVAAYPIASLTSNTKEARECKRLYEPARDAALEFHDWGFARKRGVLALLSETFSGWDYAYAWPVDCLTPRYIYDASNDSLLDSDDETPLPPGGIEFEDGVNGDLTKRIILTNEANAELIYTARVTDGNLFSSLFVDALSWRLAADLAIALRSDSKMKADHMNEFIRRVGTAGVSNANGNNRNPKTGSSYQRSRG